MTNPFRKKSAEIRRLTAGERLILTLWTCFIAVLTLVFFRGLGPRFLMAAMIVLPIIFGILLGLRLLDQFREIGKKLGLISDAPPAPPAKGRSSEDLFDSFLIFLKRHRSKGQFTGAELRKFCSEKNLPEQALINLGANKGWFREMGGAYVITSEGDYMLRKFGL